MLAPATRMMSAAPVVQPEMMKVPRAERRSRVVTLIVFAWLLIDEENSLQKIDKLKLNSALIET